VSGAAENFRVEESQILGRALARVIGHLLGVKYSLMGVIYPRFGQDHIVEALQAGCSFRCHRPARLAPGFPGGKRRRTTNETIHGLSGEFNRNTASAPQQSALIPTAPTS
jgi:hypothetical protein